jgi:hypothetical protein
MKVLGNSSEKSLCFVFVLCFVVVCFALGLDGNGIGNRRLATTYASEMSLAFVLLLLRESSPTSLCSCRTLFLGHLGLLGLGLFCLRSRSCEELHGICRRQRGRELRDFPKLAKALENKVSVERHFTFWWG